VPLDHTGSFEYGNKHHELHAAKQGADFGMCTKVVSQVMAIGGECGVPKNKLSECTFNGAWVDPRCLQCSTSPATFGIKHRTLG